MSDSEKLMALKKAYANIILNTAREAAVRIMASERKALQYEKELADTKKEALRMLMRSKQMLDSKVNEAQMAYINKQRKIDELEAQLQEAEDIVNDLREELQEVQAELERVSYNQQQLHDERDSKSHATAGDGILKDSRFETSGCINCSLGTSHDDSTLLGPHQDNNFHYNINSRGHGGYIDPGFDAKTLKEPEGYRCTERVCASEGNFTFSGNKSNDSKEEKPNGRQLEPKDVYAKVTSFSEDTDGVEENQKEFNTTQAESHHCEMQTLKSFFRKRKRVNRSKSEVEQVSCCLEEIPTLSFCEHRRLHRHEKGEANHQASAHASVENHLQSNQSSLMYVCEHQSDIIKPPLSKSPFHRTKSITISRRPEVFDSITDDKMSELDSTEPSNGYAERAQVQSCKADETFNRSVVNSVLEASNSSVAVQSQHVVDKLIKFTFQRRRKKDTLSSRDDTLSTEKCLSNTAREK